MQHWAEMGYVRTCKMRRRGVRELGKTVVGTVTVISVIV